MCLIVDANVASQVFAPEPAAAFRPIWNAIFEGRAVAVHGGRLTEEYARITVLRRLLLELERQGKVRQAPHDLVRAETERFIREGNLTSDDPHILGLAQIANVRLLCSHDRDLHADFTNPELLHPTGSVNQQPSHRHLITRYCGKRAKTRRRRRKKR